MLGGRTAYGLAISLAALAAASLTAVGFSAAAPLVRGTFGLSEVEVGAIASCVYAGAAATSVAGGRLTDRLGPAPVLVVAAGTLALGAVVAAAAPARWLFFAGVVGAGLGYGLANPPTNVLANPGSPRLRGLAMSVKQSGIPLGGILAGVLVPRVAEAVGWRWATAVPIVGCVVVAAVVALGPRDRGIGAGANPAGSPRDSAPLDGGPGSPLGPAAPSYCPATGLRLRLPLAFAFGFLMAGVQVAVFTLLTVYLVDDRGSAATAAGAALALLLAGGLAGRPAWGWLSDRLQADRGRVLQVCALLSAAFLALLPAAGTGLLPVVLAGIGVCSVGWNGVYIAAVAEAGDPARIGSTTGLALLLVNLGAVVVPPLVGLLSTGGTRWPLAWACCAGLSLASGAVLQWGRVPVAQPLPADGR
jgi:MFS family permease